MRRKLSPQIVCITAALVGAVVSAGGGLTALAGVALVLLSLAPFANWDGPASSARARR